MTILDEIAARTRLRVAAAKEKESMESLRRKALALPCIRFAFEKALKKDELSFICECKKASPSKGIISPEFDPVNIASEYEAAGADAVSVLTEPYWFLGKDEYLKNVVNTIGIPALRKDFTVDEYMLYEAKMLGASAVLLIVSILDERQIKKYIKICDVLGLSALVEIHDEREANIAIESGARIIGVNNRNLKDFSVDTANSLRLRERIPRDILFVSESGVKTADDIKAVKEMGADAVLVGEALMRAEDKKKKLAELKEVLL